MKIVGISGVHSSVRQRISQKQQKTKLILLGIILHIGFDSLAPHYVHSTISNSLFSLRFVRIARFFCKKKELWTLI